MCSDSEVELGSESFFMRRKETAENILKYPEIYCLVLSDKQWIFLSKAFFPLEVRNTTGRGV